MVATANVVNDSALNTMTVPHHLIKLMLVSLISALALELLLWLVIFRRVQRNKSAHGQIHSHDRRTFIMSQHLYHGAALFKGGPNFIVAGQQQCCLCRLQLLFIHGFVCFSTWHVSPAESLPYRKGEFRQFKDRLAFGLRKMDAMKSGTGGKLAAKTPKERKQERLENTLKTETSKQFRTFSVWTKGLTSFGMFITYKIASRW